MENMSNKFKSKKQKSWNDMKLRMSKYNSVKTPKVGDVVMIFKLSQTNRYFFIESLEICQEEIWLDTKPIRAIDASFLVQDGSTEHLCKLVNTNGHDTLEIFELKDDDW